MPTIDLTQRQVNLLRAIISEFMDTAEAVGSIHLPTKYDLGVSPATIRNEMINLAKMGLIKKSHVSSGRIPTSQGFRYFVEELLDELEEMEAGVEARMQEDLFQNRFNIDGLLYKAIRKLASLSKNVSIAVWEDKVFYSGIADMMEYPEYQKPHKLKRIIAMIEHPGFLETVFKSKSENDNDVYILIGEEEIGHQSFEQTSIVFGKLRLHGGIKGFIGVTGPYRMDYSSVIPAVKWVTKTINKSVAGWQ